MNEDLFKDLLAEIRTLKHQVEQIKSFEVPSRDGWMPFFGSWTYASASSFTVPGNVTAYFPAGTKIRLTQTTVKYFNVIVATYFAPNTTVNITGGSDYSLANAAIVSPSFSYMATPQGFPPYFNFTSTATATTGALTSYTMQTARFMLQQFKVSVWWNLAISNNGTGAGYIAVTLPINFSNGLPNGSGREIALVGFSLITENYTASQILVQRSDTNGYPGGTGYNLIFNAFYLI